MNIISTPIKVVIEPVIQSKKIEWNAPTRLTVGRQMLSDPIGCFQQYSLENFQNNIIIRTFGIFNE